MQVNYCGIHKFTRCCCLLISKTKLNRYFPIDSIKYGCTCGIQILNRTNNIFELVTVEPIPDRLENHNREILGVQLATTDSDELNRNLRLKGMKLD